jgi:transcription initiation factor TFIIF subunit alpha
MAFPIYISYSGRTDANYLSVSKAQSPGAGPIQPHEIAIALPKTGVTIAELIKVFGGRVGDIKGQQTDKKEFMKMVKENSVYGPDKLLRPK